ncbi:hypothetical protein C1H46_027826 [Malus baccata]|uniref:Uncharacterized protein n=1 Tax=Malus baccata TaxID=106549 RepID=A0A540LJG6_MALBA|nr:hypothetical protein C1H46_027826 [Malus baccata]
MTQRRGARGGGHFWVNEGGHFGRREVEDAEAGGEGWGVEEGGCGGSLGGEVEEADVKAVVEDQTLRELEEWDDVGRQRGGDSWFLPILQPYMVVYKMKAH